MRFSVFSNAEEVAARLGTTAAAIGPRLIQEMEKISILGHADVVSHAQSKLSASMVDRFLGENGENVKWSRVGPRMWVVSIDESVAWMEEGRQEAVFMSWLLDHNSKAKTNKKGQKYASIPMKKAQWTGPGKAAANRSRPDLRALIENEMKRNKISLTKLSVDDAGKPRIGVVGKLEPAMPGPQSQFPTLYSMPRSAAMAQLTGLPEHGGIALTQGTLIVQREVKRGKTTRIAREAITFRTITEAHKAEGRWFLKPFPALNSLQFAYDKAQQRLQDAVRAIQDDINK
jgi:hypothetical protein